MIKKSKNSHQLFKEDDAFIKDSKSALLDKTTPYANSVLYIIVILFTLGIVWAFFSKIEEVTVGEGRVISSSQNKIIQSLDGGTVKKILINEGDTVKENQVLVLLDDTRYKAEYEAALEKYRALLAMLARLNAETKHQKDIIFPEELTNLTDLTTREKNLFISRRQALESKIAVLKKSIELSKSEVDMLKPLVAKGFAPKLDLVKAERNLNDLQGKLQEVGDEFIEDALQNLNTRKAELETIAKTLTELKDKMHDTIIRAPVKGIIKKINIFTIGGVISPGMTIMEIVPLDESLLIETKVKPFDIAFIHPGQKAIVKITAYDYTIYGSLTGHVESISADAIDEDKSKVVEKDNSSYYRVNVRVLKPYLGNAKHKLPIFPGMLASVHILTGNKTILDYLLKPLIKAKEEALRER